MSFSPAHARHTIILSDMAKGKKREVFVCSFWVLNYLWAKCDFGFVKCPETFSIWIRNKAGTETWPDQFSESCLKKRFTSLKALNFDTSSFFPANIYHPRPKPSVYKFFCVCDVFSQQKLCVLLLPISLR